MKRRYVRVNLELLISFALAYMCSFLGILKCTNDVFRVLNVNTVLDSSILYLVLLLCVMISYVIGFRSIYADIAFLYGIVGIGWVLSYLGLGDNSRYMVKGIMNYADNPMYLLFLYALPCYILTRNLKKYESFNRYLRVFSYYVVVCSIFVYFSRKGASQYMALSYNMLLHVVYLILFPAKKYKILNYIIAALGCFVVFVGGARGAVLGLIIGGMLYYFIGYHKGGRKLMLVLVCMVFVVLCSVYYEDIVMALNTMIDKLGFGSRNIEFLINSENVQDLSSGRFRSYVTILENCTLLGRGLYADRVILGGNYTHNIFIEVILNYGYLLGGVLLVTLFMIVINGVMKRDSKEWKYIILFIPVGLVKLIVSSSYLMQEPGFYALIGFCVNCIMRRSSALKQHETIRHQ